MESLRTPTGSLSLPPRPKARMSTRMVYALCFSPATTSVPHGGLSYHDNQPCFYCLKSHHATERGDDFSPVNVDCHTTLHGLMTDARDGAYHAFIARPRMVRLPSKTLREIRPAPAVPRRVLRVVNASTPDCRRGFEPLDSGLMLIHSA